MSCIFCRIVAGELPSQRIMEDDRTLAFMDINPWTRGHALVIPKAHAADIHDVEPDDLARMTLTAQRIARAAKDVLGCDGVNLVQSSGAVAFQTVFHIHVHVVPRYVDDGVRLPFLPKPGDMAEITEHGARLRSKLGGG